MAVILTGASDGIGRAAARELCRLGREVVIVGRSPDKTADVAAELGVEHHIADFARLDEVRALADTLADRHDTIDVLANNAGGLMGRRVTTVDGNELTFQVNHLAPMLLTTRLLPKLIDSSATVIATSSMMARIGRLRLDDLNLTHRYSAGRAYAAAKLANILFTRELDRRYGQDGLSAASFEPGAVATNFGAIHPAARLVFQSTLNRLLRTPEQGADTLVWLATTEPNRNWKQGEHFEKRRAQRTNSSAKDPALAHGLWERSLAMLDG